MVFTNLIKKYYNNWSILHMGTCMGNPRNNHDLMKNTNLEKRYISS